MNLPLFIAKRYLISKRKKNFINIISILSIAGVAVITAALVIILSVFNGLEDVLKTLNNSFDPEIKIQVVKGKSFPVSPDMLARVKAVPGVQYVTEVIEDYAYARYRDASQVVMMKGVSDNFVEQNRIPQQNMLEGKLLLKEGDVSYAVVGSGVQYTLSIAPGHDFNALQIYYIKNLRGNSLDPSKMYTHKSIMPSGVFSIVQNFDENYIVVPLDFARELLDYGDKRTSLEIKTLPGYDIKAVEADLQSLLGDRFSVLNHEEQHQDIFRLVRMEKLFSFLAFTLLLAIGSVNIFFTLMMMALDKKKDIAVIAAMGAHPTLIRNIFLAEGALISCIGTIIGLVLAAVLCFLQMKFGFVSMGMQSAVIQGYPVKMVWTDFLYTLLVVAIITFLISIRPAVLAARTVSRDHL